MQQLKEKTFGSVKNSQSTKNGEKWRHIVTDTSPPAGLVYVHVPLGAGPATLSIRYVLLLLPPPTTTSNIFAIVNIQRHTRCQKGI